MANPLRHPILSHQKHPTPKRAQAALDAASLWLCQSGELLRIYQVWPDITQRSPNLHKILAERLNQILDDKGRRLNTELACHCHPEIVSVIFQINEGNERGAWAETTIPLRLYYDKGDLI